MTPRCRGWADMGKVHTSSHTDGCPLMASDSMEWPGQTMREQSLTMSLGLCLQVPSETWRLERRLRPQTSASQSRRLQHLSPRLRRSPSP